MQRENQKGGWRGGWHAPGSIRLCPGSRSRRCLGRQVLQRRRRDSARGLLPAAITGGVVAGGCRDCRRQDLGQVAVEASGQGLPQELLQGFPPHGRHVQGVGSLHRAGALPFPTASHASRAGANVA